MKRGLTLTFALAGTAAALLLAAPVRADSDLDRIMSALARRQHGHVTFTEEKYIAMLEEPVKSSGELLYDAPGRLEKRTLRPKPESLVLQDGIVTVDRGRRHYALDLRQYPQIVPFIESIRATLAGDRAALERVFQLQLTGAFDAWTLTLKPQDATLSRTIGEIDITGAQDAIQRVEIREADGDRSVMTIGAAVSE